VIRYVIIWLLTSLVLAASGVTPWSGRYWVMLAALGTLQGMALGGA
jgi:hypothetical protein